MKTIELLTEQDAYTKFFGRLPWTRLEIFNKLNDLVQDYISDGVFPEGTELRMEDITDEVAQKYADDFVEALYDTAGERMAEAHGDLASKTLKSIKTLRRRMVAAKRQQD